MTDCENAALRDLLPEYVAESLDASTQALVSDHLLACESCRHEVALLTVARAIRPREISVDQLAIVERLLALRQSGGRAQLGPRLVGTRGVPAGAASSGQVPQTARRLLPTRGLWRFAAALGVVALGSLSLYATRDGRMSRLYPKDSVAPVALSAEAAGGNITTESFDAPSGRTSPGAGSASDRDRSGLGVVAGTVAAVSVGDLSDYSEAELQGMLDRLNKWDGASSSEVMPTLPIVPVTSSGVLK